MCHQLCPPCPSPELEMGYSFLHPFLQSPPLCMVPDTLLEKFSPRLCLEIPSMLPSQVPVKHKFSMEHTFSEAPSHSVGTELLLAPLCPAQHCSEILHLCCYPLKQRLSCVFIYISLILIRWCICQNLASETKFLLDNLI